MLPLLLRQSAKNAYGHMISGGDLEKVTLYKWATPFIATFKADDKSPRERKDYQIV